MGNAQDHGAKNAQKLPSLDIGRFFAALLVVLFHSSFMVYNLTGHTSFDMVLRGGHSGVEYFFVLSGFIIYYVHRFDLGQPSKLGGFARKRVIRIIPMLWLILIPWGILKFALPGVGTQEQVTPSGFISDLLLLPHGGGSVLGVLWTLRREAIFYLLFAVAIWNRRVGIVVLITWQILIVVQRAYPFMGGVEPGMLFGISNLGFGMGMLIAAFLPKRPSKFGMPLIILGVLLYGAVMAAEWYIGGPLDAAYRPMGNVLNELLYAGAAAVLVIGMVSFDFGNPRPRGRLAEIAGGSSYVLYLVHLPFGSIFIRVLKPLWPLLPPELLMLTIATGAVLFAAAVHLWVEKPLLALLRPKRPVAAALP